MKTYTFKRESNNFDDILNDPVIKRSIDMKLFWADHIMVGIIFDTPESIHGYLVLKYGDCMINPVDKDFTPIPGRDYIPKKDKSL